MAVAVAITLVLSRTGVSVGADARAGGAAPARPLSGGAAGGGGGVVQGTNTATRPAEARYVAGGGRGSAVRLATLPEVQADLGLSAAQKSAVAEATARLKAFEAQLASELQRPPAGLPAGSDAERQWVSRKFAEANQALSHARLEIGRALAPAQMQRLEQIGLQELGPDVLFRADIVRVLNLTPAQQRAMGRIRDGLPAETAGTALSGGDPAARDSTPPKSPTVRADGSGGGSAGASRSGGGQVMTNPPEGASRNGLSPEAGRRIVGEVLTWVQRAKLRELQGRPIQLQSRARSVAGSNDP